MSRLPATTAPSPSTERNGQCPCGNQGPATDRSMTMFAVPIQGLTVAAAWDVGPIAVRPATEAIKELQQGAAGRPAAPWFFDTVEEMKAGAFAYVNADDFDEALVLVTQAVDVLRVFQHARHYTTELTQFGVPGDVQPAVLPYAVTQDDRAGLGFKNRGHAVGWTFSDPSEWASADIFRWVA